MRKLLKTKTDSMLNRLLTICIIFILAFTIACNDPKHPGFEYMPDMYHSKAYETYAPNPNYKDSVATLEPVEGTIPRGFKPIHYNSSPEDYERAGAELTNPIEKTDEVMADAKHLYTIYCAVCHGAKGKGDGTIVERGVFPPPPDYAVRLEGMPDGKMFHAITFGKNLMGPYNSQLTVEERWKVIHYIKELAFGKENPTTEGEAVAEASTEQ